MVVISAGYRIKRAGTALAGVVLASTTLSGCGFLSSGSMVAPVTMPVSSASIDQNVLPRTFTCHGKGTSPSLSWGGAPSGTKSYALVVDDASAPITPYIYWIVFNISDDSTDIQEGGLPPGARTALNSAGTAKYDPPCPQGSPHQYRFTVYALDTTLTLPDGTSVESAWTQIAAATIGRGRLPPVTANP